jgi:hypothetical protein
MEVGIDFTKARYDIFNTTDRGYLKTVSEKCKIKLLEWNYDDYEMSQMQKGYW